MSVPTPGVTITQQPTSPNAAYTKLMYVVESSRTNNPQFKYVADLYLSGSETRIARFKTPLNADDKGVFDFSVAIQQQLGYDNNWEALPALEAINYAKKFVVAFGEEYGTSTSSSVTVYNGLEFAYAAGDPEVYSTGSFIFKGINDMVLNNSYNFNVNRFDTSSFTEPSPSDPARNYDYDDLRGPRLSNNPIGYENEQDVTYPTPISASDWETISFFTEYPNGSNFDYLNSYVKVFNSAGTKVGQETFHTLTGSIADKILTLGVGPQSFRSSSNSDVNDLFTGSWSHYEVNVVFRGTSGTLSSSYWYVNNELCSLELSAGSESPVIQYNPTLNGQRYPVTRFAFINEYGTWDYYSIPTPIKKSTKIKRENNIKALADYSSTTSTFNISNRTDQQYYASLDDNVEITTEYIDQNTANWLTELFESPNVFEQVKNEASGTYDFVPVVVTNKSYIWDTDGREHLFQYKIKYKRANQRRSRL
jgi:hypothetical protein